MTLSEKQIFSLLLADKKLLDQRHFDDAALIHINDDLNLVISTDFIRGPLFSLAEKGLLSLYDLAHYLVAANVSDVAAMGAIPKGFLDVFRYPVNIDPKIQEDFFSGLSSAVSHYSVELVGGDSGSYKEYVLSGTCFGFIDKPKALLRKNLRAGELLCYSGNLGGARAALIHFLDKLPENKNDLDEELLNFWRRPSPPLTVGPLLSKNSWSKAAQDSSDGLASTIYSMCEASGVGSIINEEKLPIAKVVRKVALESGRDLLEIVLSTSPDFGLLFSISPENLHIISNGSFKEPVCVIGEITEEIEILIRKKDGETMELPRDNWSQGEFKI